MTEDTVVSEETEKVVTETKKPVRKKKMVKGSDVDVTTQTRAILQDEEQIQVNIASTERDKTPVFVGINGHSYKIKRDTWVYVPKSVVAILDAAITMKVRPVKVGNETRSEAYTVSRFAHSTKA